MTPESRKRRSMYDTILVTLDGTPTDRAIIEHVKQLAKLAGSKVVLLHVADGWAARTYGPDAVSPEIAEDTAYLEKVGLEFRSAGGDHVIHHRDAFVLVVFALYLRLGSVVLGFLARVDHRPAGLQADRGCDRERGVGQAGDPVEG